MCFCADLSTNSSGKLQISREPLFVGLVVRQSHFRPGKGKGRRRRKLNGFENLTVSDKERATLVRMFEGSKKQFCRNKMQCMWVRSGAIMYCSTTFRGRDRMPDKIALTFYVRMYVSQRDAGEQIPPFLETL